MVRSYISDDGQEDNYSQSKAQTDPEFPLLLSAQEQVKKWGQPAPLVGDDLNLSGGGA